MTGEDRIKQFEIVLIELNRYLAYNEKDSAINCYNKLHGIYNNILSSDIQHDQKHRAYNRLMDSHKKITSPPQQIISIPEAAFLTLFVLLSAIVILMGPEITGMLIAKQKINLVKNIYMISTFLFILFPITIVLIKNALKK
ncbi:hypothetical protein KY313_02340 [Candidatus Woesearchaeota archaeon]|jgi:hypothetical protein|nr:hypothetical protein [Candidatus Woesearchaeota archaeon]